MIFLIVIIVLALVFDYINGFHDAANSIATIVSTKVLSPLQAVIWAAAFNFVAYFVFQDHAVANTIGKTVYPEFITLPVIFSGLIAAIFWNLLTWWFGIPSSSSHTLIGGFAGAAITHAYMTKGFVAFSSIVEMEKIVKTILFIFLAPVIGMAISMFMTLVTIMRNVWARIGIIILATLFTVYLFNVFEQNKMQENLSKLYKADKYEKELTKDPNNEELKHKLEKAKAHTHEAMVFAAQYKQIGADAIADSMEQSGLLKPIESSRVKDALKKVLNYDSLSKVAKTDAQIKILTDSLTQHLEAGKAIYAAYGTINQQVLVDSLKNYFALSPAQTTKVVGAIQAIHVKKEVVKEIKKADNSFLVNCLIGLVLIFILTYIYIDVLREPNAFRKANIFKRLQLLSSAAFSLGHGGNDAQKVMGIIGAAFVAYNSQKYGDVGSALKELPWVPLACYTAIGLGTLSGGWKIVKTMGSKITKVTPLEGVTAETAGAFTLFMTEQMGIPVSTTHTITGAIMGVGASRRLSAVRWGVTFNLVWAWILTIPVSAIVAAIVYAIVSLFV
jgi:PiT family inorganic phosphate transporter